MTSPETSSSPRWLPQPVDDVDLAFPARGEELAPPAEEIPQEFYSLRNPWVRMMDCWFAGAGEHTSFEPAVVEGQRLDGSTIHRHLSVVLGCYGLRHEHKLAAAAWLASTWMDSAFYGTPQTHLEDYTAVGASSADEWISALQESR